MILEEPRQHFDLPTPDGMRITLRRYWQGRSPEPPTATERPPVLIVHGASASSSTFLAPRDSSFVDFLRSAGFDVWLLDWRGSGRLVKRLMSRTNGHRFTIDHAAAFDLPTAVSFVASKTQADAVSLLAHCIGGAVAGTMIAMGGEAVDRLGPIVFSTLALHFQMTPAQRLRGHDSFEKGLYRALQAGERRLFIDPRSRWSPQVDAALTHAYGLWRGVRGIEDHEDEALLRAEFMFGLPFRPEDLHEAIGPKWVRRMFGPMPLALYAQGISSLHRGVATPPAIRKNEKHPPPRPRGGADHWLDAEAFRGRHIEFITGERNAVWSPQGIESTRDWLTAHGIASRLTRIPHFGHQDLFWARHAPERVFPTLAAMLEL